MSDELKQAAEFAIVAYGRVNHALHGAPPIERAAKKLADAYLAAHPADGDELSIAQHIDGLRLEWKKGDYWECVAQTVLHDAGDNRGLRYYVDHRGDSFMYWFGTWLMCHPCDSIDHGKQLCEQDFKSRVWAIFNQGE